MDFVKFIGLPRMGFIDADKRIALGVNKRLPIIEFGITVLDLLEYRMYFWFYLAPDIKNQRVI